MGQEYVRKFLPGYGGIIRFAHEPGGGGASSQKPHTSCAFFYFSENMKTGFQFSPK
jgi:hypothetical protein